LNFIKNGLEGKGRGRIGIWVDEWMRELGEGRREEEGGRREKEL